MSTHERLIALDGVYLPSDEYKQDRKVWEAWCEGFTVCYGGLNKLRTYLYASHFYAQDPLDALKYGHIRKYHTITADMNDSPPLVLDGLIVSASVLSTSHRSRSSVYTPSIALSDVFDIEDGEKLPLAPGGKIYVPIDLRQDSIDLYPQP